MPQLEFDAASQSKREFIESVIEFCKPFFDEALGFDFSKNDCLKIAYCNFENRAEVYEDFCKRFFPLYLSENYDRNSIFVAQSFTNADDEIYGILICLDMEPEDADWYQIIFHEMSHIFCISREFGRDNFTAKYLSSAITKSPKEQCMDFGYAIWREFIADYISYKVRPITRPLSFAQMREVVRELDPGVCVSNPEQTVNTSIILAHIFVHPKIQEARDIETVLQALKRNRIFSSKERCEDYRELIKLIFHQLEDDYCWEITPQFIVKIGWAYLLMRLY